MNMNRIYDSFGFLFAKASNQLQDKLSEFLSKNNLTPKHMGMILIIYENDGITQKRAGEIQQVDRTTVTQIIDYLEERGYVIRNRVANDRRAYGLSLSKAGITMAEMIYNEISEVQNKYLHKLSETEISTLKRMMILLTAEVEDIE
ncbi:MarR family winged helix-turn-helix transcriptional regulator [Clostridium sp. Marseille-P299]|uniref:MarR family winged helix-turn-helix transcriptional regulator n=1 Tax=Clostridium sp. Marseille-P299 TaxID=1805477 RepID=UPI000834F9ED|nr:MarR family transcriptional regulator [Clostridium sp. Marseille-P299]